MDDEYDFTCENCAERRDTEDGRIICHNDGEEKDKNDTCNYWW